jgi:ParB-like chromosome segregation protein Spo0J
MSIPGADKVKAAKDVVMREWLNINPGKSVTDFWKKVADATGYHGVLAEVGEERAGALMSEMIAKRAGEDYSPERRIITGERSRLPQPSDIEGLADRAASDWAPRVDAAMDLLYQGSAETAAFAMIPGAKAFVNRVLTGRERTPTMTSPMRSELKARGFSPETIHAMDPKKALEIIFTQPTPTNPKAGQPVQNGWRWAGAPDTTFKVEVNDELGGALQYSTLEKNGRRTDVVLGTNGTLIPVDSIAKDDVQSLGRVWVPKNADELEEGTRLMTNWAKMDNQDREGVLAYDLQLQALTQGKAVGTRVREEAPADTRSLPERAAGAAIAAPGKAINTMWDLIVSRTLPGQAATQPSQTATEAPQAAPQAQPVVTPPAAPVQPQPAAAAPVAPAPQRAAPVATPSPGASTPTPVAKPQVEPIAIRSGAQAQPGGFYRMAPSELNADGPRFQYKSFANEDGVTPEGRIEGPWDSNFEGTILAWKDPADGKLYVINGHHRLEAAKRLGVAQLTVKVVDDMPVELARVTGAITNIIDGKGSAIDAAKVIRGTGFSSERLRRIGLSDKTKISKDGLALAKLSDPIFQRVAQNELDPEVGAAIGAAELDEAQQMSAVKLIDKQLAKGRDVSRSVLARLIENVKDSAVVSEGAAPQRNIWDILGDDDRTQNTALEEAELAEWLDKEMGRRKVALGAVARSGRADILEEEGVGVVDADKAKQAQAREQVAQHLVRRLSQRGGPIKEAIKAAAIRRVANGEPIDVVRKELFAAAKQAVNIELGIGKVPATPTAQPKGAGAGVEVGTQPDRPAVPQSTQGPGGVAPAPATTPEAAPPVVTPPVAAPKPTTAAAPKPTTEEDEYEAIQRVKEERRKAKEAQAGKAVAPEPSAPRATPPASPPQAPQAEPPAAGKPQGKTEFPKLPKGIYGAKQRYGYREGDGEKANYTTNFVSDIDRAAYIARNPDEKSDSDQAYVDFVMDAMGWTEDQVRAHGRKVQAFLKSKAKPLYAKGMYSGELEIQPLVAPKKAAAPDKTPKPAKLGKPQGDDAELPFDMRGNQPYFNYKEGDGKQGIYKPGFASAIDEAAYIATHPGDKAYRDFVMHHMGWTSSQVDAHGARVRRYIESRAQMQYADGIFGGVDSLGNKLNIHPLLSPENAEDGKPQPPKADKPQAPKKDAPAPKPAETEADRKKAERLRRLKELENDEMGMEEPGGSVEALEKQSETSNFKAFFKGSKVVDAKGQPLLVYRGEHSSRERDIQHREAAISFAGDRDTASLYAEKPNNRDDRGGYSRVYPAYLRITNPVINDAFDPFLDMSVLVDAIGADAARAAALRNAEFITETNNWEENFSKYASVAELLEKRPDAINEIYGLAFPFLADPIVIKALKAKGFDGAIHGGMGENSEQAEYKVFDRSQIYSALSRKPFDSVDDVLGMEEAEDPREAERKRWSRGLPIIPLDDANAYEGGPAVFTTLHGTQQDFDEFDLDKANVEAYFGAGIYSTTSTDDAAKNYANLDGPDISNRIELRREFFSSNWQSDEAVKDLLQVVADDMGLNLEFVEDFELVLDGAIAREFAHAGATVPLYVRLTNPVVFGGNNPTTLNIEETYDEVEDEYGEPTGTGVLFAEALREAAWQYDGDGINEAIADLFLESGEVLAEDAMRIIKERASDYTDDNGNLVINEIIRQAFEAIGYDGIVDLKVSTRFNMEMPDDTAHIVAFRPNQVKSALGNKTFSEDTDSILGMEAPSDSVLEMSEPTEDNVVLLRATIDAMYERGAPQSEIEAEEARLLEREEALEARGDALREGDIETEDALGAMSVEENLAYAYYHQFVRTLRRGDLPKFGSKSDAIANMRESLGLDWRPDGRATDAEVLEAAKDAYDTYAERIARIRQSGHNNKAMNRALATAGAPSRLIQSRPSDDLLAMSANDAVELESEKTKKQELKVMKMIRIFVDDGITDFAQVVNEIQEAYGPKARQLDEFIEAAWDFMRNEDKSVADVLGPATQVEAIKEERDAEREAFRDQKIGFGKYANVKIGDIANVEPGYVTWLLEQPLYTQRAIEVARFLASDPQYIAARDARKLEAETALSDEIVKALAEGKMSAAPRGDGTVRIQGRGTRAWGNALAELGARHDKRRGSWILPLNAIDKFATMVQADNEGKVSRKRRATHEVDKKVGELRRKAMEEPDRSAIENPREVVGAAPAQAIQDGVEAGAISQTTANEQIEDAAKIVRAYAEKEPMFLLASEPGSGKTYVAGAAIAAIINKHGAQKVVYVTLRNSLIKQVKEDLKNFGIEDKVEFITYTKLREMKMDDIPKPDVLVFDEAHYIKNIAAGAKGSRQAKLAQTWIHRGKFVVFATATPYEDPVQAKYLGITGLFDKTFGSHRNFALAFGATGNVNKTDQRVAWRRTETSDADLAAAQEWFRKRGIFASRRIRLPDEQVDSRMVKVDIPERQVELYAAFAQSAFEERKQLKGAAPMWMVNFSKRLLEASKVEAAIKEAKSAIERGRFPIIFVETKAQRTIDIPDLIEKEREWARDSAAARAMGEMSPRRKDYGLPPQGTVQVLESYMVKTGDSRIVIPSAEDVIAEAFGDEAVAIYTGSVSDDAGQQNLQEWRDGKKPVLVATMAKGGTGLSLHDKVGDHQTTQINLNLPWTATSVAQVTQRSARYGLKGKAEIVWLFSDDIAFDRQLARRVGGRMADMGAIVHGVNLTGSDNIENWDFSQRPFSEDSEATSGDFEAIFGQDAKRDIKQSGALTESQAQAVEDTILGMESLFDEESVEDDVKGGGKQPRLPGDVGRVRDIEVSDPKVAELPPAAPLTIGQRVVTPKHGIGEVRMIDARNNRVLIRDGRDSSRMYPLDQATTEFKRVDAEPKREPKQMGYVDRMLGTPTPRAERASSQTPTSKKAQRDLFNTKAEETQEELFMSEPTSEDSNAYVDQTIPEDTPSDEMEALRGFDSSSYRKLAQMGNFGGKWQQGDQPISESNTLRRVRDIFSIPLIGSDTLRARVVRRLIKHATRSYPVRNGKVRSPRALGTYHRGNATTLATGLIRLRRAHDLETAMHELGHMIDKRIMDDLGDRPYGTFAGELRLLGMRTAKSDASNEDLLDEGVAEYFRIWAANPQFAEEQAPQYTEALYAFMERNPGIAAQMLGAQVAVRRYLSQPAKIRGAARIDFTVGAIQKLKNFYNEIKTSKRQGDKRSLLDRFGSALRASGPGSVGDRYDNFHREWLDRNVDFKRASTDMLMGIDEKGNAVQLRDLPADQQTYLLQRLKDKADAAAEGMIYQGVRGLNGRWISDSLMGAIEVVGDRQTELSQYLTAMRAIEIHKENAERKGKARHPGMTYEEALDIKKDIERDPEFHKFAEARDGVRRFLDGLLEYSVEGGFLKPEEAARMAKYADYVPLQRVMDMTASQFGSKRDPYKNFKGSGLDIIDPLQTIIRNTVAIVKAVESNKADAALVQQAMQTKYAGQWLENIPQERIEHTFDMQQISAKIAEKARNAGIDIDSSGLAPSDIFFGDVSVFLPAMFDNKNQNVLSVKIGGERQFFQVNDHALWDAIVRRDMAMSKADNIMENFMSGAAHLLRVGATMRPSFIVTNFFRDAIVAGFQSRHGFIPGYDTVRGLKSLLTKDEYYKQFVTRGIIGSSVISDDRNRIQDMLWEIRDNKKGNKSDQALKRLSRPVSMLQQLSEMVEAGSRLGEFKLALENPGGDRRVGVIGVAQRIGDAIAGKVKRTDWVESDLVRASIAASDVTVDFSRGGYTAKEMSKYKAFLNARIQGYQLMAETFQRDKTGTILTSGLLMLMAWAIFQANKDDDEYLELSEDDRRRFFFIRMPWQTDSYTLVAKPFDWANVANFVEMGLLAENGGMRMPEMDEWRHLAGLPTDYHQGKELGMAILPTLFIPFVEVVSNYDQFRGRPIIDTQDDRPGRGADLQVRDWTSDTAILIGKMLGVSPAYAEHLIHGYGGGLLRDLFQITDGPARDLLARTGPEKPSRYTEDYIPGARAVYKTARFDSSSKSLREFYNLSTNLESNLSNLRDYEDGRGQTDAKAYKAQVLAKFPLNRQEKIKASRSKIDQLQKKKRAVYASTKLTPDQKRDEIEALFRQMVNEARKALGRKPLRNP